MEPALFLLGQTLLQSLLLAAVFVALYDIAERYFPADLLLAFSAAVFLLGAAGYLAFWLAWASYPVFGVVKIVVLAALAIRFALLVYRRRLGTHLAAIGEPMLYVFLFFIVVLTLGFANGGTELPYQTAARRFAHELPMDNLIPFIVAQALKLGRIASPLYIDWLSSDRPPLQTGLYLLLNLRNNELGYQIVSSWVQATFLFGAWGLVVAAGVPVAARRLTMLACCLLPPAILNTFYTWPKLLAVGYVLLCFALLFRRPPPEAPPHAAATGVLIGGFAALSVLSHGSSAFALIGFGIAVAIFWAWPSLKAMIAGAASLLALYGPWMVYQSFIDPPGNRLMKWHLAGVLDVDPRPLGQTLREAYGALTWHDYWTGKLENLSVMLGTWPRNLMEIARLIVGRDADIAPAVRVADFFQFLPSLHLFSLALILALVLLLFWRADAQRAFVLRMIVALVATVVAYVFLVFIPGQTINHVGSYAMHVMVAVFAITVLSLRAPVLALAFVLAQAVTVSAVYAFTLQFDVAFWPLTLVSALAAAVLLVYSLAPLLRGRAAFTG